jgi:hypothetical protein
VVQCLSLEVSIASSSAGPDSAAERILACGQSAGSLALRSNKSGGTCAFVHKRACAQSDKSLALRPPSLDRPWRGVSNARSPDLAVRHGLCRLVCLVSNHQGPSGLTAPQREVCPLPPAGPALSQSAASTHTGLTQRLVSAVHLGARLLWLSIALSRLRFVRSATVNVRSHARLQIDAYAC